MKRPRLLLSAALSVLLPVAATAQGRAGEDGPTLVVLVSVDQLRGDLLTRYDPAFTGGFRRLLDQGLSYSGASHAHAVTHTAAGHATLGTGVFPRRSGIVANSWSQRTQEGWDEGVYAVADPRSPIVGLPEAPGRSPRNLLRDGLGDWVMQHDPQAQVVSIGGKDRSAITLAGHARGQVYWLMPAEGRFVTSTYYRDRYPDWVERFNREVAPGIVSDRTWNETVPQGMRGLARVDEGAPYEGDGTHTTFPHRAEDEIRQGNGRGYTAWALSQPRMDHAVVKLARTAVDELRLGARGSVDYLALALSATDYVGHGYGPLSQEQLDNLVRLDGELAALFDHLDRAVGRDGWVLGLSADHGVMTMPEALDGEGEVGRRLSAARITELVADARTAVESAMGSDTTGFARALGDTLVRRGIVAQAYTHDDLRSGAAPDSFAVLFQNSYLPGRAPGWFSDLGLEVRFPYNHLVSGPTGTSHGSPYWYDRWVPLAFMGPGVPHGSNDGKAYTVDMAPTLAALAGIPVPVDLDGRSLMAR